jgi:hypothetical protein
MITKARVENRLWVLVVVAVLSGCNCRVTEPLPAADIVFQTATSDDRPYSLGFLGADGENLKYIEVRLYIGGAPIYPAQTSDGTLLAFCGSHGSSDPMSAITSEGHLVKYEGFCGGGGSRIAPVRGSHQVVIAEPYTGGSHKDIKSHIQLLDLDAKVVAQTYLTTTGVYLEVGTNALHDANLIYVRGWEEEGGHSIEELVSLNTETQEETVLVSEEKDRLASPAISPNGQWVAYTTDDGIYVVSVDGGEPWRVVEACVEWRDSGGYDWWIAWPPAPSWSPDSQWLVYHRCTRPCSESCQDTEDYSVFKTNVGTGEEVLLVEGGLNPYWRLDSSE